MNNVHSFVLEKSVKISFWRWTNAGGAWLLINKIPGA
jgi:hypothetical protein